MEKVYLKNIANRLTGIYPVEESCIAINHVSLPVCNWILQGRGPLWFLIISVCLWLDPERKGPMMIRRKAQEGLQLKK